MPTSQDTTREALRTGTPSAIIEAFEHDERLLPGDRLLLIRMVNAFKLGLLAGDDSRLVATQASWKGNRANAAARLDDLLTAVGA